MAQRTKVPKFGNWESDEIPYTICFDNATKGKKNSQINQNGPNENFEAEPNGQQVSDLKSPKNENHSIPTDSPLHPKALKVKRRMHGRQLSQEEGDMRKLTDSPVHHENGGRRNNFESPRHGAISAGDTPRRASRQSVGSDRSVDHSPMHPHSLARVGGKNSGISSPSWERNHGQTPSTPGRSRLKSVTRGDDTPDHGPAIPKFGEWDETDPATAEGYSIIFNQVREEKHNETGKVPIMPTETSYSNSQKQYQSYDSKGCGCFGWGKR